MAAKKPTRTRKKIVVPKKCYFCEEGKTPSYADVSTLQKYVSDRGKIFGRVRTGICAKHQRQLTSAIKYARHLALMPFVSQD